MPAARRLEDPTLRTRLIHDTGRRAFHDFVLGPRAGAPGTDPSARVRASWVARLNVLVVLAIVALGLSLFR